MKYIARLLTVLGFSLCCASCATVTEIETSEITTETPPKRIEKTKKSARKQVGVYHKIQEGETLWRIAKTYNVTVPEIVQENSIPDAAGLEVHQLIFIPGATEVRHIVQSEDVHSKEFMWPVKGKIVHYFNKPVQGRVNRGIGIKVKPGTEVVAARTGTVVFADYLTGFGYSVILDHEDGLYSMYGNNAKIFVTLGDSVIKRTLIARVGQINRNPSVAHFEIREKDKAMNPLHYLPRR